jgi:hypothetical protein
MFSQQLFILWSINLILIHINEITRFDSPLRSYRIRFLSTNLSSRPMR